MSSASEKIDYEAMSKYFNKSSRTLRRWENEKPQKFKIMLEEFSQDKEEEIDKEDSTVFIVASLKGGVGKSTISAALAYYLGDAVIVNADISQRAENINGVKTIDFIKYMEKYSLSELVNELKNKFRYIIIDTPGEATEDVFEALSLANKVIIPMTIGKRTRDTTIRTLDVFFGENTIFKNKLYEIYFFFNAYANEKKRIKAEADFLSEFTNFRKNKLSGTIKLNAKLGKLKYSDAISTAEEEGKAVMVLAEENRVPYKTVSKRVYQLCKNMEEFFIL